MLVSFILLEIAFILVLFLSNIFIIKTIEEYKNYCKVKHKYQRQEALINKLKDLGII